MRVIQDLSSEVWSEVKSLSRVWLFATPWNIAYWAPPSMGFSRQEYWSGLPFPSPGDLPNPGIKTRSPALPVDALPSETQGKSPSRSLISAFYNMLFFFGGKRQCWALLDTRLAFSWVLCAWPSATSLIFLNVDFLIHKLGIIMV